MAELPRRLFAGQRILETEIRTSMRREAKHLNKMGQLMGKFQARNLDAQLRRRTDVAARELVCVQNYQTVDKRLRVDAQLRRQPATTLSRPAAKQGDVRFRVDLEKHGSWIASKKLRSRQRAAVRRAQYIQQKKKQVMRGSVCCKPTISDHIMILVIVMFICFIKKIKALRRQTNNQNT